MQVQSKLIHLYQHEDPLSVGNDMRMLVSDMAGRASIELKSQELGIDSREIASSSVALLIASKRWNRADLLLKQLMPHSNYYFLKNSLVLVKILHYRTLANND